jgi:alpha,alpha-trehalase
MRIITVFICLILAAPANSQQTPDQIYGELFHDVQMNRVFPDGKTFVDCTPKREPKAIVSDYKKQKATPNFSLANFVKENFDTPVAPQVKYIQQEQDVAMHIKNLWGVLKREKDVKKEGSSLIPLPNPYIVPGGRFGEIFYWDSYFTMLGLKESGEMEMIENMIKNFAYLINTYGHIPNGNRTYFLSRSQPPFFSMMVQFLAEIKGRQVFVEYLPALEKEYQYWMQGSEQIKNGTAYKMIVKLDDGTLMNRYWDESTTPRQESYREDIETAEVAVKRMLSVSQFRNAAAQKKAEQALRVEMYQHLRAGAASGWDFSSRWFTDPKDLSTIEVAHYIPVDLNSLLYQAELNLKLAYTLKEAKTPSEIANRSAMASLYDRNAQARKKAIDKYCWNESKGMYSDYHFVRKQASDAVTLAAMFPLFVRIADKQRAEKQKEVLMRDLFKPGGFATTTLSTGQQWDAPNGWAPLQWIAIKGLQNYYFVDESNAAIERWVKLNKDVYSRTGKLMEKYNVMDTHLEAGGGEYPSQDGFGWTNGVLLALMNQK